MKRWIGTGMMPAMTLGLLVATTIAGPSWAQVVERERDVTITGPRGRSIERSITSERGPGFAERDVKIQRPGGTFHSNSTSILQRPPANMHHGGGFGGPGFSGPHHAGGWGYGPRPFIGREVIINNGGGAGSWLAPLAVGLGSFGVGMLAGSALATPPPPVIAVPPPTYVVQPPPTVIYNAPQPYVASVPQPTQPPQTVVVDPVVDAVGRLQSHHANSRRDGALTLGQLRDPRAIPALVDRLRTDTDENVRAASATALGAIGDPRAAIYLERVTIYDKKQKVRDAAALALARLPRESAPIAQPFQGPSSDLPVPSVSSMAPRAAIAPEPEPIEHVPPPPTPALSGPGFRTNP
jgi:hypothetical protein